MTEYQAGKDVALLGEEVKRLGMLIEQLYAIVEHNIEKGKLEEPKEKKK